MEAVEVRGPVVAEPMVAEPEVAGPKSRQLERMGGDAGPIFSPEESYFFPNLQIDQLHI